MASAAGVIINFYLVEVDDHLFYFVGLCTFSYGGYLDYLIQLGGERECKMWQFY